MNRRFAAYIALWLFAAVLVIIGGGLVAARSVEVPVDAVQGTVELVDVVGVGIAVLCTGIVSIVVALVLEIVGLAPRYTPGVPGSARTLADIRASLAE